MGLTEPFVDRPGGGVPEVPTEADLPSSGSTGEKYVAGGVLFEWNGSTWVDLGEDRPGTPAMRWFRQFGADQELQDASNRTEIFYSPTITSN